MSAFPQPTPSRDGSLRLSLRIEHRIDRAQLITIVMVQMDNWEDGPEAYAQRGAAAIRRDIDTELRNRGDDLYQGDDGMGVTDFGAVYELAAEVVDRLVPGFAQAPAREPASRRPRADDGPVETFEWPPETEWPPVPEHGPWDDPDLVLIPPDGD